MPRKKKNPMGLVDEFDFLELDESRPYERDRDSSTVYVVECLARNVWIMFGRMTRLEYIELVEEYEMSTGRDGTKKYKAFKSKAEADRYLDLANKVSRRNNPSRKGLETLAILGVAALILKR
jgi:hypothetical protein